MEIREKILEQHRYYTNLYKDYRHLIINNVRKQGSKFNADNDFKILNRLKNIIDILGKYLVMKVDDNIETFIYNDIDEAKRIQNEWEELLFDEPKKINMIKDNLMDGIKNNLEIISILEKLVEKD